MYCHANSFARDLGPIGHSEMVRHCTTISDSLFESC